MKVLRKGARRAVARDMDIINIKTVTVVTVATWVGIKLLTMWASGLGL